MTRNLFEWITDQLLFLYVSRVCTELGIMKKVRTQKIIFIIEHNLWKNGLEGLDYQFIRHNHGPYSGELDDDIKRLIKCNLLRIDNYGYHITSNGLTFLDDFDYIFERNNQVKEIVIEYCNTVMSMEYDDLLESIYESKNPLNKKITIDKTPMKKYLLSREMKDFIMKESKRKIKYEITESEAEDLEIYFDPRLKKIFDEGNESVKNGELTEWVPSIED